MRDRWTRPSLLAPVGAWHAGACEAPHRNDARRRPGVGRRSCWRPLLGRWAPRGGHVRAERRGDQPRRRRAPSPRSPSPGRRTSTPPSRPRGRPCREWSAAPPAERSAALHRLAGLLHERAEEFAQPRRRARPASRSGCPREFDVPGTIDNTAFFAGAARTLEGRAERASTPPTTPPSSAASRSASSARSRRGTTRCRWPAWKILPAIAAGNTIVLKPSELTPLTALMMAEAARDAGHPGRRGQRGHRHRPDRRRRRWSGHPDVDMVSFTGSLRRWAGAVMASRCGHRQARAPGARRQGAVRGLRRRRPRGGRARRGRRSA